MAISIDPQTRVIFVPQADLTLVSGTNYELDVNAFRLELKDLEDNPSGMYLVDTHNHTPPVTLSGSTYARFVEIINGYKVEFEDGQYAVSLKGANNNIVDVLVRNQVSVVANNSSGLIESDLIEYSSFQNQVTIRASGSAGTTFPIGTPQEPVNNLADALTIAQTRGFDTLHFEGPFTIQSGDNVSFYKLTGDTTATTVLTFEATSNCLGAVIKDMTIQGTVLAPALCERVQFENVTGATSGNVGAITLLNCVFNGTVTLSANLIADIKVIDCYSGVPGSARPVFDLNGAQVDFFARNYCGGMEIRNMTNATTLSSIDMNSGHVYLDSTCTDGSVVVRGISKLTDNSNGTAVDSDNLIQPVKIATKSSVIQASQL